MCGVGRVKVNEKSNILSNISIVPQGGQGRCRVSDDDASESVGGFLFSLFDVIFQNVHYTTISLHVIFLMSISKGQKDFRMFSYVRLCVDA